MGNFEAISIHLKKEVQEQRKYLLKLMYTLCKKKIVVKKSCLLPSKVFKYTGKSAEITAKEKKNKTLIHNTPKW